MLCKRQIIGSFQHRRGLQSGLAVAILLASVSIAHGQATYYWANSGSDDWATGANWSNGSTTGVAPGSADTAYLGYGGTAGVNGSASCATLYVGSDQSFYPGSGTLNINAAANLSGVGTMYLGSNVSGYMGTVTQSGGAASVGTITFGGASAGMAGGTYNLNGGTLGVGSGGITLGTNGTAAMNLGGGTLQPSDAFSSSVPLTLTSTSTIDTPGSNTATFSGLFSGAGGLNKTGDGTLVLGTPATFGVYLYGAYTGDTRIYGGVLALTSENHSYALYSSCLDYNNYGGTIVFQGAYNDVRIGGLKGGQDLQLNDQNGYGLYLKIVGGFNTTYSGVLSETYPTFYNAALIQNGTGSLTLSGQSTFYGNYAYQGSVELWSGALVAGASSTGAPGSVTSGPFGAGTVDLSGGTLTSNGNWTIANALKLGAYNLGYNVTLGDTSANTLTLSGNATLSQNMTLTTPGNGVTMSGNISGGYGITKAGAGTLTLSGSNSYSGTTTISAGR